MAKETAQKKLGTGGAIAPATTAVPTALSQKTQEAIKAVRELSDKDFYSAGGDKLVPGARALQHLANEDGGVTTQIMEHTIDNERASVRVRGWRPGSPDFFKEDVCTIIFSTAFQMEIWRLVDKGCPLHRGKGCPIQKDGDVAKLDKSGMVPMFGDNRCFLHALENFLRIKNFADRTCVTKAEGRVHAKLLNVEWRDEEEIEEERREIEVVANGKDTVAQEQSKAKPAAAEKKAEPAKAATTQAQPAQQAAAAPKPATAATTTAQPAQAAQPAANGQPGNGARVAALATAANVTVDEMLSYVLRAIGAPDAKSADRKNLKAALTVLESFRDNSGTAALSDLVVGKAAPDVMNAVAQAYEKERAA
jgi:hypothetical protein